MLNGEHVSLADILTCRERRVAYQQHFLSDYNCPVISFCLNIPGPVKTNPELRNVFDAGKNEIIKLLNSLRYVIIDSIEFHEKTGDEMIMCIDGNAPLIKKKTTLIEEKHPLGRLFDIDVIDTGGNKLSRSTYRRCLICNCQAQECSSTRKHSVEEMQDAIEIIINQYLT